MSSVAWISGSPQGVIGCFQPAGVAMKWLASLGAPRIESSTCASAAAAARTEAAAAATSLPVRFGDLGTPMAPSMRARHAPCRPSPSIEQFSQIWSFCPERGSVAHGSPRTAWPGTSDPDRGLSHGRAPAKWRTGGHDGEQFSNRGPRCPARTGRRCPPATRYRGSRPRHLGHRPRSRRVDLVRESLPALRLSRRPGRTRHTRDVVLAAASRGPPARAIGARARQARAHAVSIRVSNRPRRHRRRRVDRTARSFPV